MTWLLESGIQWDSPAYLIPQKVKLAETGKIPNTLWYFSREFIRRQVYCRKTHCIAYRQRYGPGEPVPGHYKIVKRHRVSNTRANSVGELVIRKVNEINIGEGPQPLGHITRERVLADHELQERLAARVGQQYLTKEVVLRHGQMLHGALLAHVRWNQP